MNVATLKAEADRNFARKRFMALLVPTGILVYFVYIFFAFDVLGLSQRAKWENGATLLRDTYSYKTHITRNNRGSEDGFSLAEEGERKGRFEPGVLPDWMTLEGQNARIELDDNHIVRFEGPVVFFDIPNYGTLRAEPGRRGIELGLPDGVRPDFISASRSRVDVRAPGGRLIVTRSKTEIHRYFFGWELFWFTHQSPFYGKSFAELVSLAGSDVRLVDTKSNLQAMWHDFWYNPMWQHASVAWAIGETILMAFLGTFAAGILALPLAFLSARNFTTGIVTRFSIRRLFDFLRGIDGLIWTIVLARAFGPGPLTGSLAIMLTDTGTFGKLFSEALENVDNKQIEGVKSTGASTLQQNRFGVIPQITPVFVSQLLYYLESNTRSATIIGAIVGGGIGLNLTQAIITGKDWEEVTYYIVLIILMVMMMDTVSGWLRKRLIGGNQ